jgi:AraC-like DNA-binding protein
MLMLEAIGRAADPGWAPDAIYLPGRRSQRFARDELFRGVNLSYGAPNVTVVFPARLLSRRLKPLMGIGGSGQRVAEGTFEDPDIPGDFTRSLRDTVASLLPLGCPTVQDLADVTDLKPRTLQRRLAECGTSLRQVIDDARFGLAAEYLRDPAASVTDIALDLGYGDSTAFTRAFHRLAGVSPTAYREQRLSA